MIRVEDTAVVFTKDGHTLATRDDTAAYHAAVQQAREELAEARGEGAT